MNDEQPRKKRSWVPIVLGVLALGFVLTVGGCFVAISLLRQQFTVTETNAGGAESEFDKVRARFAGQKPLFEMVDGKPQFVADRAAPSTPPAPLKTMHIMAWDDDEGHLVTFAVPFWLLRLKSGPIRLSAYSQGWDDRGVSFRVEDLEKHGPGLLMDLTEPAEGRVLIWAE